MKWGTCQSIGQRATATKLALIGSEVYIKLSRENNIRSVLRFLRQHEVISVAEISEDVKLSKTTVKKIIDLLVERRLVISAGKGVSTGDGGKKPELYRFNRSCGYVISTHVTPDEILAAMTDLRGDITHYQKSGIRSERSLQAVQGQLVDIIRSFTTVKASTSENLVAIVVALPGLADATTGVSIYSPHYPSWGRNVPFADMLRERLGSGYDVPIFIDCVNRYQAIAEREKGVANGASNFIIVDALDEGLGSGIVLHGKLMRGNQSLSGEIGHMTVNPVDGPLCICGNRGCFEAMVSAKRISAMAREAWANGVESVLFRDGEPGTIGLDTVCEAAVQGDAFCVSLVDDVARWFVVGLGNVVMVNDPELIIIQGQYVKAGDCFLGRLREGISHIGLPDVDKRVRIEYSELGEERGVIGGAAFVLADYFSSRLTF
jgi:predicted NBD/HSP70 family sugar kinase